MAELRLQASDVRRRPARASGDEGARPRGARRTRQQPHRRPPRFTLTHATTTARIPHWVRAVRCFGLRQRGRRSLRPVHERPLEQIGRQSSDLSMVFLCKTDRDRIAASDDLRGVRAA